MQSFVLHIIFYNLCLKTKTHFTNKRPTADFGYQMTNHAKIRLCMQSIALKLIKIC